MSRRVRTSLRQPGIRYIGRNRNFVKQHHAPVGLKFVSYVKLIEPADHLAHGAIAFFNHKVGRGQANRLGPAKHMTHNFGGNAMP